MPPSPSTSPPPTPLWRTAAWLLAVAGLQVSLLIGRGDWPPGRWVVTAIIVALGVGGLLLTPPGARLLARASSRDPDTRAGRWRVPALAAIVFGLSAGYLILTALRQGRAFLPNYQDEFSYLLQARMIASGRLWMPVHELAAFFESFQILVDPVYASIYFPGAALAYAVGVLAGAPMWVVPLLMACGCVVLTWWIARQLFGPAAGWAAAALLLALTMFRLQSLMAMAQIPVLLAGLGRTAGWLRWRRTPGLGWTMVVAAAAGWAAITRPVDALCFAIPIGIAMAAGLTQMPRRRAIAHAAAGIGVVSLFAALQLVLNAGITGSPLRTPFDRYAAQFYPGTEYGFGVSGRPKTPQTSLPQKVTYYRSVATPVIERHTPVAAMWETIDSRLKRTLLHGMPHAVLLILVLPGFLQLRRREMMVVAAPLPLFLALYWPYAFFLPHYTLTAAPAVIFLVLAGTQTLSEAAGAARKAVHAALLLLAVLVAAAESPEMRHANVDEFFTASGLRAIDRAIADVIPPEERAIVLFRWVDGCNPEEEPVYNITTAWPDDARVIRAHDLGDAQNQVLYRYYAEIQPTRLVYHYDRGAGTLERIGRVDRMVKPNP